MTSTVSDYLADPQPFAFDASLTAAAHDMAANARPLLRASDAMLLSVTTVTCPYTAAPKTVSWNEQCLPVDMVSAIARAGNALHVALTALEDAGTQLLTDLIRRWPVNALPPIIGIVTDGSGIAFSSEHPSPLSPNWLARHLGGACPTMTLLPFAPTGAWARLTTQIASPHLH